MKNLIKIVLSAFTALAFAIPAFAYPDVTPEHWAAKQIEILTEQMKLAASELRFEDAASIRDRIKLLQNKKK